MPTRCDCCGEEHCCIYITREYKKLCGDCYDHTRPAPGPEDRHPPVAQER